jgi:hypothetical protein
MIAGKNRVRLALEQLKDRCTPSLLGGELATPVLAPYEGPYALTAARVHAPKGHAIPFKVEFQCIADLNTLTASATGVGDPLGPFTGQGRIDSDSVHIDQVRDRGEYKGTYTVATANGDQLFCSFTTSWRLSTGKGKHSIEITGGTGLFAGASGHASLKTMITADPASPSRLTCNSSGSGVLTLRPQREEPGGRVLSSGNPAISISDVARAEGHNGQTAFTFTVSLSQATAKEVSVKYATANGTARTGDGDFIGKSGTLKFAPGETTKTITILVNGDRRWELDETFFVNLSGARNATIADAQGVGTILSDDSGGSGADNPSTDPDPNPPGDGF